MQLKTDYLKYEKKGNIAYITLNRSEKKNAINEAMLNGLRDIWNDFDKDNSIRVAILTGSGNSFCAGMDVGLFLEGKRPDSSEMLPGFEITKPVIAAVNGYALGSGFRLALSCDLRIACETAYFGIPELKTVGHLGGLPQDLLQYMPLGIAMEFLLLGEPISARRAYEIGMVNRITSENDLIEVATNIAQSISENAPLGVKVCKTGLYLDAHLKQREDNFLRRALIKPQFESEDYQEAIRAFKEGRKPQFKGK